MAEPRQGHPRVGDEHLEPPCLGTEPLDDHPGRPALQRLGDERMPVVPRPLDRNEDLAGVEPAAIGRAAGDLPVGAPHEPGIGKEPPQAHRGNPPLG